VQLGCLSDQPGEVLHHVPSRRKHERMYDDPGRALLDAAGEALRDRGLCDLHVRRLDDASGAEALLHERGDLAEQRVGFGSPAAVVDQQNRFRVTHQEYLGLRFPGVKNCPAAARSLRRKPRARASPTGRER